MIYRTRTEWRAAPHKRICLFGMSGLGKTHLSSMLEQTGRWHHYCIDERIGNHHLRDELAANNGAPVRATDLSALSEYLGRPGNVARGGLPMSKYRERQARHQAAEVAALLETGVMVERGTSKGLPHFVCDTGGSLCEVVDPANPEDPILTHLAQNCLIVWLESDEGHAELLQTRFDKHPKPLFFDGDFLKQLWEEYLARTGIPSDEVNPDDFMRHAYGALLFHRQPLYEAISTWGITLPASVCGAIATESDLIDAIAQSLPEE